MATLSSRNHGPQSSLRRSTKIAFRPAKKASNSRYDILPFRLSVTGRHPPDPFKLQYFLEMFENERILRLFIHGDRQAFSARFKRHIKSAKEGVKNVTDLYSDVRSGFLELCMQHDRFT